MTTGTAPGIWTPLQRVDTVLHEKYKGIFGRDGFLEKYNEERHEEIDLLGLCSIAGVDPLFLGDPGVGKTWMIELLVNYCLSDMTLFTHLFAKDQSADEVLGPQDIMARKAGIIKRLIDGFLPKANFAYGDEIFKASPPMLNPLLDITATRKLKVGGNVLDVSQLIMFVFSSNELPDREDLAAFRSRIAMTKVVQPVRTPEGRRRVTDIQLQYQSQGLDTYGLDPLTLGEVHAIQAEVNRIVVPDAMRDLMGDFEQKCMEAGHSFDQRRKGRAWQVVKTHAWAAGRTEVLTDDFLPCQHMFFDHLDHAASAREIVLEAASEFARKANRLREALEPIEKKMEELRAQLDAATDQTEMEAVMDSGFPLLRQVRTLRKEARVQIKDGQKQGQDTSATETVLADIERLHDWAEARLTGTDDDED